MGAPGCQRSQVLIALPSLGVGLVPLVQDVTLLLSSQRGRGMEKKNAPSLEGHEPIDGSAAHCPLARLSQGLFPAAREAGNFHL